MKKEKAEVKKINSVIGKQRICSCCGNYYQEWKEQDIEGQNCPSCTVWVLRGVVKQYHRSIELLLTKLKPENQEKLKKSSFLEQRMVVEMAFEKKYLKWTIE